MQPQPSPREEAWDEAAGPRIGERISCLDLFVHYNGDKTTAMWRPAVVVEHVKEGGAVQEIKVHFEGFSAGYDKWVAWPRERDRFASLGTSGSRTPSDLANGSFDGLAARGSDTDSRSNSYTDGDGSSSTGTAAAAATTTRRRGFSRLNVFGAMKGLRRSRGNSSKQGRTPTLTPPLTGPRGSSFSPAKAGRPQWSVGVPEGRSPAELAALAALCFEEHEFKQEEKVEGRVAVEEEREGGAEESKRYQEEEEDAGFEEQGEEEEKLRCLTPAPPSPSVAEEESKQQEEEEEEEEATTTGGGSDPPSPLSNPPSAAATATSAAASAEDGQREDFLPPTTGAESSSGGDSSHQAAAASATTSAQTPPPRRAATTAEQAAAPAPAPSATITAEQVPPAAPAPATRMASGQRGGWRAKMKSRARRLEGEPAAAGERGQTPPLGRAGRRPGPGLSPAPRSANRTEAAAASAAGAAAFSGGSSPLSSDVDVVAGVVEEEGKWEWRGRDSATAGGKEDAEAEAEAAAAMLMQETARRQPIRELTPYLVEELEGEGGGFTLTVFKNNKQDQVPVPLVCGKYTTAYEADRAAEAFSSPVWHEPSPTSKCAECQSAFRATIRRRRHHCRNCGRLVCNTCANRFWTKSMLPHSYRIDSTEKRVRVCRTCYSTGKNFRRALLQGSYLGAMEAYSTGCVNLRDPCSHVSEEVALLDSKGRSVMAAAAESGQIETMRYLAFTQPSTVTNLGVETLWWGLQACLRYDDDNDNGCGGGGGAGGGGASVLHQAISPAGGSSCYKLGGPSDGNDNNTPSPRWGDGGSDLSRLSKGPGSGTGTGSSVTGVAGSQLQAALDMSTEEAGYDVYDLPGTRGVRGERGGGGYGARRKNSCIVCFSRKVNATLVPCGHHVCCMPCTEKFELCPVCRVRVTQKIKTIDG